MNTIFLSPFMQHTALGKFELDSEGLVLVEETPATTEEIINILQGSYARLNGNLIAVFTIAQDNFLALNGKVYPFTSVCSLKYQCAEDFEQSSISIELLEQPIFEVSYVNPHEPLVLDFPDWSIVNFAFHLDRYLKLVRANPNKALFETLNLNSPTDLI